MTITADTPTPVDGTTRFELETPFLEEHPEPPVGRQTAVEATGFVPWTESLSPFAEASGDGVSVGAEDEAFAEEIFEGLHDESFDEALAELIGETAEAVDQRLMGETATALLSERQRLGDGHLAPILFEAERYVDRLSTGLIGLDIGSLSEEQLAEMLDRFDPVAVGVSPAGEEFIGAIARKAKKAVQAAAKVAAKVALPLVGPVLNKLKSLIRPLLRRVLAMAINRLPAQLQEPARLLAKRFGFAEAEAEEAFQAATPVAVGDPEALAESFDAALTETLVGGGELIEQGETFGYEYEDDRSAGENYLETLAEARSQLVEKLSTANDGEDMAPAIEQFVPALLPALRIGIRLVGRPKVVSFLAGYVARLIKQWVGPSLARPLSTAIVDTGLRLATLEHPEPGELEAAAGPTLLATTIEDTVRRLAEQDEFLYEDEDLLQLAVGDAFEESVATNFPAQFVRPELQVAPTLAGSFLPRFPSQVFSYKKYSQVPEVQVTAQIAESLRTFGGVTLAAALRARGRSLPIRVRVHVYESTVGTSLPRLARLERVAGLGSNRPEAFNQLHPLTPEAASVLLREPRLGVKKPTYYLRSRHRIAVGQRFFYLEPVGNVQAVAPRPARPGRAAAAAKGGTVASSESVTIDLRSSEAVFTMFFSEADAQSIATAMARTQGGPALLKALLAAYDGASRAFSQQEGNVRIVKEYGEGKVAWGSPQQRVAPVVLEALRRKLDAWAKTMLAQWARARGQEFARAAQDPASGVTVSLRLRGVPGLNIVRQAMIGKLGTAAMMGVQSGDAFRGTPNGTISVAPGRRHQ